MAPRGGPGGRLFLSPMGEPFRGSEGGAPQDRWFDGVDANHDGALSRDEMEADARRFFAVLDRNHDGEIDPDDIDYYENTLVPEVRSGGPMGGFGGGGRMGRGGQPGGGPPGGGRRGRFGGHGDGPPGAGAGGHGAGKQGAARFGYLDYPQPITSADRNLNRGVDPQEFERAADDRFALLDRNGDGRIEKGELPRLAGGFGGGRGPMPGRGEEMPPPPQP